MDFLYQKFLWEETFNEIVALGKKFLKKLRFLNLNLAEKNLKESFIICKKIR